MIIEAVVNMLVALVQTLFGWINLPAFPASLDAAIQTFESLIFDNLFLLGLFVNVETLKVAVPLFVVIVNFDKLYRLTMWVIKKLPLGIK